MFQYSRLHDVYRIDNMAIRSKLGESLSFLAYGRTLNYRGVLTYKWYVSG